MTGASSQVSRRSHIKNALEKRFLREFYRRCKAGEDASKKSISEWAFDEMKMTVMPSQSTIARLYNNKANFVDYVP